MCSEPAPQERGVSVSGPGAAMPRCQPGPGGVHTGPGAAGPVPTDPGSPSEAVGESGPPLSPTCSIRPQPRAPRAPPSALQHRHCWSRAAFFPGSGVIRLYLELTS